MSFAPLHCHSNFSLLYGTIFPEYLVNQAQRYGLKALALTDNDAIYGLVEFHNRARKSGIKPLPGVTLSTTCGDLVCLAENNEGYKNICRLVTKRKLGEERIHPEVLQEYHQNL